ncbi:MAG: RNA polymerase sigma factor [Limisphaerales bacterium]
MAALRSSLVVCDEAIAARDPPTVVMPGEAEQSTDIAAMTRLMVRGDEAAYRAFYELYFNRLLRYLLVLTGGREDTAREALQLTLLRIVRYIKTFDAEAAFWNWLAALARSAVVDEARKQSRYRALLDRFIHHTPPPVTASNQDTDTQLLAALERRLAGLPPDERQLIERKYFDREPVKAIANRLQSTEKAIDSRLGRIRWKLKELILTDLNDQTNR